MNSVLLRCQRCGAVNRVAGDKLSLSPKCGRCKKPLDFPKSPVDVTSSAFQREVNACPGTVLVEFWSPLCGHCQRMNPLVEELAARKAGFLKLVKINTQTEQNLASRFGIRGVPTFILYRGGRKIREHAGALTEDQLESWLSDD